MRLIDPELAQEAIDNARAEAERAAATEIAELRAERDDLKEQLGAARMAICSGCGEVDRCDEDRCCLTCGRDLIIVADRQSAELLIELSEELLQGRDQLVDQEVTPLHNRIAKLDAELKDAQEQLGAAKAELERVHAYHALVRESWRQDLAAAQERIRVLEARP